ncbi:hypothetical protein NBRC116595_32340 [Aliiglaciecola sp. NS0011-25]
MVIWSSLQKRAIIGLFLLSILGLLLFAFYWNEARKEVVFLCANFSQGVSKTSVLRQLKTVNLSSFTMQKTTSGDLIVLSSVFNFEIYQCVIEIDSNGQVHRAQIK